MGDCHQQKVYRMNAADTASISPAETFERLGKIARQLHEALSELGLQQGLVAVTQEIPDARERLTHIGEMTELAANKVLNLIDEAQPRCDSFKQQSLSMAEAMHTAQALALASFWARRKTSALDIGQQLTERHDHHQRIHFRLATAFRVQ